MAHRSPSDESVPHASTPKRHADARSPSSSTSEKDKGPSADELKMLRAKFRTRFHRFSANLTGGDKAGEVRIKTSDKAPITPTKAKEKSPSTRSARMQEFEPTIFEPVKGGHRPAKTKMRVRKMQFRERKKHRTSKKKDDQDSSSKKSKSAATAKDTKPKSIMQASGRCERELSTREIKKPFEKVKLESTKETPPGSSSSDERQTRDPEASSKSTKAKKRKKTADATAEKSEKSLKEMKTDKKDKEKSVREVPSVKEKKESKKEIKKDAKPKRDEQKASDTVKTSATPPKKERTTEKPSATSDKPKDETQQPKPRPTEPQALPTLDDIDVHTAMPADMLVPGTPQLTPTSNATSPIPRNLSTENVGTSAESLEPSKSPGANDSLRLLDHKSKEVLFEKLDEDIVLDDKVLQDIAKDLKKGVAYDNKLVDESLARKLMEIDNKTVSEAEIKKLTEQAYEQDETAMKIVDALTSPEVLGKVLAAEESKVLSEYFSGTRPQDEQVLNVLNVALEKILDRSHEFYANKEELKRFLEHRDRAKMRLLDALLSRNSSVLRNMWVNAYRYADMISRGIKGAYVLAGRGIEAAQEGYKYTAAVASASYEKANELAGAARDLARKSQEAVSTAKERTEAVAAATRGWIDAAVQLVTTTPPTPPSSRNSSLREDVKDPPSTCSSTSTEDSSSLSTSIKDDSLQSIVKDDSTRTAIPSEPSTNSNKSEPPPQPAPKTEPIRHTAAGAPSSELREDPTQAMSVRADSRSSPPEGAAEPRANEAPEHWLWTLWYVLTVAPLVPYVFAAEYPPGDANQKPPSRRSAQ